MLEQLADIDRVPRLNWTKGFARILNSNLYITFFVFIRTVGTRSRRGRWKEMREEVKHHASHAGCLPNL